MICGFSEKKKRKMLQMNIGIHLNNLAHKGSLNNIFGYRTQSGLRQEILLN